MVLQVEELLLIPTTLVMLAALELIALPLQLIMYQTEQEEQVVQGPVQIVIKD